MTFDSWVMVARPLRFLRFTMDWRLYVVIFQRIRHHRDRFKRQQGANLYLPESYVTEGGTGQDAGPWTEWSTPSLCSRSCGGGVSTITRQCTPGYACQGPTTRHFSCNTQVMKRDIGTIKLFIEYYMSRQWPRSVLSNRPNKTFRRKLGIRNVCFKTYPSSRLSRRRRRRANHCHCTF